MRYIRVFSQLSGQIKYSSQKRVLIEVALVKLCQPSMEEKNASLEEKLALMSERLSIIEQQLASGSVTIRPGQTVLASSVSLEGDETAAAGGISQAAAHMQKAMPEDLKSVIGQWGRILSDLPPSMSIMLKPAKVAQGPDNKLVIGFDQPMNKSYFDQENHKMDLETAVSERVGRKVEIVTASLEEQAEKSDSFFVPGKVDLSGVDFSYEDE